MERLIRAANFTRYYSRDVDKLSQLPRNCRVRATYHPSNLAQREIAASCAARVPHASFPRAFPSVHDVCIYTYRGVASPLASPSLRRNLGKFNDTPSVVHRAWQSFSDRATTNRSTNFLSPPPPINEARRFYRRANTNDIRIESSRMKATESALDMRWFAQSCV